MAIIEVENIVGVLIIDEINTLCGLFPYNELFRVGYVSFIFISCNCHCALDNSSKGMGLST